MKNLHSPLTLLILAAVIALAACTGNPQAQAQEPSPDDISQAQLQNIFTRASVRQYQKKAVEADKIETLLRAAMSAPTAMDRRPWHFIVVTDTTVLKQLDATNPHAGMLSSAPLAIVACGDMNKAIEGPGRDFWIQDLSAASENILLAANALGLGAVWTGGYPAQDRCDNITKVLNLPETLIPLNIIVIGYPLTEPTPKDKWDPANISYNHYGQTPDAEN